MLCERFAKCPFFTGVLQGMPKTSKLLKEMYCQGEHSACARYLVAVAGLPIPDDLFPNEERRAREIIQHG